MAVSGSRPAVGLDRVRPRRPVAPPGTGRQLVAVVGRDVDGKRALYSGVFDDRVGPGVALECSRCGEASTLSVRRTLSVLTPSLHFPLVRRGYPSLVRCPACRRPSWVRFRLLTRPVSIPASRPVGASARERTG
jgi:hypothetical protein